LRILLISLFLTIFLLPSPAFCATESPIVLSGVRDTSDAFAALAVMKEAYGRLGRTVEIKWSSGVGSLQASGSGQVDAELERIAGLTGFPDLIQIPVPINVFYAGIFTRDLKFDVEGWESLKPYRIGIVKGIQFAEQGTRGMNVVAVDTYYTLIDLLVEGKVDVAIMPKINGQMYAKEKGADTIQVLDTPLETLFLYHYIHKKNRALIPELQKVLKQMLLDGTTRKIREETYRKMLAGEEGPWNH